MKKSSLLRNQRGSVVIIVVAILVCIYIFGFFISRQGWGYTGYYGYHHGPSFWYFGGPNYYRGASVRSGSVSGPSHVGGGLSGGK